MIVLRAFEFMVPLVVCALVIFSLGRWVMWTHRIATLALEEWARSDKQGVPAPVVGKETQ